MKCTGSFHNDDWNEKDAGKTQDEDLDLEEGIADTVRCPSMVGLGLSCHVVQ